MRTSAVSGIIFANTHDEVMGELSEKRSMASIPFGGRYRIIDFTLSNLVNAGISNVALITKGKYRSLMDHVGSGIFWDLDRKSGGLHIFPPYITSGTRRYHSYIEALYGSLDFIERCNSDYIVLCGSDCVANIDVSAAIKSHMDNNADITVVYKHGKAPKLTDTTLLFSVDGSGRINSGKLYDGEQEDVNYCIDTLVFNRDLLSKLIRDVYDNDGTTISGDMILPNLDNLKVYGFEHKEFAAVMDSVATYFDASMKLLDKKIRDDLFKDDKPIYTKTRDDMPTRYGTKSSVQNCFIGDGCIIEGTVKNCILFRGVTVKKGAKIENCILMQGTVVESDADLCYVIADKNSVVGEKAVLHGVEEKVITLGKNQSI